MKAETLLAELLRADVHLWIEGDRLRYRAPKGVLTSTLRNQLSQQKEEIIALLQLQSSVQEHNSPLPKIVPAPEQRYQPFPLNDIQQAYWLGRNGTFEVSNVSNHLYLEIDCTNLDLEQLNQALQVLIERHDMLRAIVLADGQQQILASVPLYQIQVLDLRSPDQEKQETAPQLDAIRQRMSLFQEWAKLYHSPETSLTPLALSFRDYVLAEITLQEKEVAQSDMNYWQNRLPTLPPAPELPLAKKTSALTHPQFVRQSAKLEPETWLRLKTRSSFVGLTPSGILLAAYAQVLATWSKSLHFTLNVTLSNRQPSFHSQVNELVGVFSSVNLLEVDYSTACNFQARAQSLQQQLWRDLEHLQINGIQVLRELARLRETGLRAQMPVVFTSTLVDISQMEWLGEVAYFITQTPQVWLDCQIYEQAGALVFNWDAVEELFPSGMLQEMFQAYHHLLLRLADDDDSWQGTTQQLLPPAQLKQRSAINSTEAPIPDELLQTLFSSQVRKCPHQVAVVSANRNLTYAELERCSNQVGNKLRQLGVRPNTLVAVVMEKGWEQVVAVLGILQSGAAYLPIDPGLPQERLWYLLENGQVSLVLTQSWLNAKLEWPDVQRLCLDNDELAGADDRPLEPVQKPEDSAYVIYTSGSTGLPKGVMIAHRGVVNAIDYTNQRFSIGCKDRVLALTALHHDLSVYDIFGILAAGGTIIIPNASDTRNPAHWTELMCREQVTFWNSVPTMMEMLVEYAFDRPEVLTQSLRLAFLGGDSIPLTLPDRLNALVKGTQVVSVGGPTETTLWNICYSIQVVDSAWKSIPYGQPIANTRYYVLNEALEHCPIWVSGHLYCAGVGLALGYWQNEEKTSASFIHHPKTGERLYRTGDLGRYLPDGNIEFLGREDFQIKIGGYRIELGEIEAALVQHSVVHAAVVTAVDELPEKHHLVAYVVLEKTPSSFSSNELRNFLKQKLPLHMVPAAFVFLDALPLTPNGKIDRRALPKPDQGSTRPEVNFIAPCNPVEEVLAGIWVKLLGLERVSVHDNFFKLGGNSLLAVQFLSQVRNTFEVELPLHCLFNSPTVRELAQALEVVSLAGSTAAISKDMVPDLNAEAVLDSTIYPEDITFEYVIEPAHIFLTGATGFLGAFLLHELLEQTQADIYCLVRSSTAESGKKRLQENLASYSLWNEALSSRIIPVLGDLSQPFLSFSLSQLRTLASKIDSIYHNGALVNFTYPYQALKGTNVLGTQEVLRLASQIKIKPVHFISTTTVFSTVDHSEFEVIQESTTPEHSAGLHTGYTQSKWVAEQLIAIARFRNLPISIYRPSFVAGHGQTGAGNTQDFLFRMIKGCIQLGNAPDINMAFSITPVDYVSKAIIHLSKQKESRSKTFHLVNPHHIAIHWSEIVNWTCSFGYPLQRVTYEQWQAALSELGERSLSNALYPLLPLFSKTETEAEKKSHQLVVRQFDCQNTLIGLVGTSLVCPPVNAELLSNYLSYFIRSSFLEFPDFHTKDFSTLKF